MDEILSKYFSGVLSETEIQALFIAMESDENIRAEYIRLQNLHALTKIAPYPTQKEDGLKGLNSFRHKLQTIKRRRKIGSLLKYAAISLLLISSTFFITRELSTNSTSIADFNTLYVPAGQRAQLTLSDGTKVWLNAQSSLTYPSRFTDKQREVSLVGEAYFDVTEDQQRPFIVITKQLTMKVLGTEFNVYSYPEAGFTQTSLVEGSLLVSKTDNSEHTMKLSSAEQIVFKEDKITLKPIFDPDHLLWRDGIYAFNNERLVDIIAKLELYYDITIKVVDPDIFNIRFTGKFRQRDGVDDILHILQKIQFFKIEKDRDNNIITLSK